MSDVVADSGASGAGEGDAALGEPVAASQAQQTEPTQASESRRRPRRRASFGVCLQPATRATSLAGFNTAARDDRGELGHITAPHQTSPQDDHARAPVPRHGLEHNPVSHAANEFWLGVRMPSHGADRRRSAPDPFKRSILHMAAESGDTALCGVLLGAGTAVDARDKRLLTPLHLAALHGRHAVARLLLSWGANPAVVDERGRTPLHLAAGGASAAHASVIAWLLLGTESNAGGSRITAGASSRPCSELGDSGRSCGGGGGSDAADTEAHSGVISTGARGADPRVPDRQGRSALDVAASVAAVTCSEATTVAIELAAAVAGHAAASAAMAASAAAATHVTSSSDAARVLPSLEPEPEHGLGEMVAPERSFSLRSLGARASATRASSVASRRAVALLQSASTAWELWSPLWLGVGQYQTTRGNRAPCPVEVDAATAVHGGENTGENTGGGGRAGVQARDRVDRLVQRVCGSGSPGHTGTTRRKGASTGRHMRVRELQDRARLEVRRMARWAPLRSLCRAASRDAGLAAVLGLAPELLECIVHFLPGVQSSCTT